jgi:hypothetical protein
MLKWPKYLSVLCLGWGDHFLVEKKDRQGRFSLAFTVDEKWEQSTNYIYLENHSVCPLVRIGTPTPIPQASVFLPPGTKGGIHSPAGEGVGESQFEQLEKKVFFVTLNPLYTFEGSIRPE